MAKRYNQPQSGSGAQIDWGNLITRGLCVVSVPNGGSVLNVSPFNVEKTATKFGSIPSVVTRQKGLGAFAGLDNTNAWRLHSVANQTTTAFEKPSSEITVLAFIERFGNNASGNAFIFGNTTTSTSPYVAWALYDLGGAGVLSFEISTSGATRTLNTGTSMPTVPTVLVGTYNGATQTAYMGGKVVGTPVSVTGSITYPSAADRGPAIGNFWEFTSLNRSFNGAVYLAALWDRALSDAEIKSISDNPWQLFRAANAPIFVPVSGGGGSSAVTSDSSANYLIRGLVTSDASASYLLRTNASSDTSASYAIRAPITSDTTVSYLLRTAAISDTSASYAIAATITSDTSASYSILTAGAVTSDSSASYSIRGVVQSDASIAYELRGAVQSTLSGGYDIRQAVASDTSAAYAVTSLAVVTSDLAAAYAVTGVAGLSEADIAAIWAYGVRTITGPTAADIAAAVIALAQTTPIQADLRRVTGQAINGAGTEANPWGP